MCLLLLDYELVVVYILYEVYYILCIILLYYVLE